MNAAKLKEAFNVLIENEEYLEDQLLEYTIKCKRENGYNNNIDFARYVVKKDLFFWKGDLGLYLIAAWYAS